MLAYSSNVLSQVESIFIALPSGGCNPLEVTFQNLSTGAISMYIYNFGDGTIDTTYSAVDDVIHTFDYVTNFSTTLTVVSLDGSTRHTSTQEVNVVASPNVDFSVDNSFSSCLDVPIQFNYTSSGTIDSLVWIFDDGTVSRNTINPIEHTYLVAGTYTVELRSYYKECYEIVSHDVTIAAISGSFSMDVNEGCENTEVVFTFNDSETNADSYTWYPRGRDINEYMNDITPYAYTYDSKGDYVAELKLVKGAEVCYLQDSVFIYNPIADINYSNTYFCNGEDVLFIAGTEGDPSVFSWDFGDGTFSSEQNPTKQYGEGNYNIKLRVEHAFGCPDSITDNITINSKPEILTIGNDTTICLGQSVQLHSTGNGDAVEWTPPAFIDDEFIYNPMVTPLTTIEYKPQAINTITGCRSDKDKSQVITVIQVTEIVFELEPADTTIKIGEKVVVRTDSSAGYKYSWLPTEYVSCSNCATPTIQPLEEGVFTFTLTVADIADCQSHEESMTIAVEELYASVGVPKAFTPNGDGINDIIKVDGWGIKSTIEFRVYNRSGIEVFYSDNLDTGWDGTYKNKEQSVDTYTYYFKVERFDGKVIEEQGAFTLLR
jgi:gliding motility-associated-like protein